MINNATQTEAGGREQHFPPTTQDADLLFIHLPLYFLILHSSSWEIINFYLVTPPRENHSEISSSAMQLPMGLLPQPEFVLQPAGTKHWELEWVQFSSPALMAKHGQHELIP